MILNEDNIFTNQHYKATAHVLDENSLSGNSLYL